MSEPRLMRWPGIRAMAQGAAHVMETQPADVYWYNHFGAAEDAVADLVAASKTVYRGGQFLHIDERSPQWVGSFDHFVYNLFEAEDWWLRHDDGELARFKWFGGPLGPDRLPDWGRVTPAAARLVGEFVKAAWPDGPWLHDQVWTHIERWMLTDPAKSLYYRYSPFRYLVGIRWVLRECGWPGEGRVLTNGSKAFELPMFGALAMYENADQQREGTLDWAIGQWQDNPGSILSVVGNVTAEATRVVLDAWLERGGILWAENPETANVAWAMKESRIA